MLWALKVYENQQEVKLRNLICDYSSFVAYNISHGGT